MERVDVAMLQDMSEGRVRRLLGVLALTLALSACASSEQVRERQAAAQATEAEEDDAKCKDQGLQPDTPEYAQCRDRLSQKRAEEAVAAARRSESFQRTLGEGTSGLAGH